MPLHLLSTPFFEDDGFPLAVRRMPAQDACAPHSHDFHELVVVVVGSGMHVVDGRRTAVGRGAMFLVEPGTRHSYEEVRELGLVNVLFLADELALGWGRRVGEGTGRGGGRVAVGWLGPAEVAEVEQQVAQLEGELENRGRCHRFAAVNELRSLLLRLARADGAALDLERSAVSCDTARMRVRQVIRRMHVEFADAVDLNALAAGVGMSARTFRRNFHEVTGLSPVAYLARLRVQEAAMRLRVPGVTVTQVAFDVGFNDLSFFDRRFKRIVGETPHAFRDRMRQVCPTPTPVELYPSR